MSKSAKPRKKYVPKVKQMPVMYATADEAKTEWQIAAIMAMDLFMKGHGSAELAYTIIGNLLLGQELTKDPEEKFILHSGLDAMKEVIARSFDSGKWGFSGDQLNSVKRGIFISDKLQSSVLRRDMIAALNKIMKMSLDSQKVCTNMKL